MPITVSNLRKSPGHLLRCAHQYSTAIALEHLAPHGLTVVQFATLVALREHPGLDATRLAALINFDRPTLTGVIDRLAAKGLVVRNADPQDRRTRLLQLTPEGEQLLLSSQKPAYESRNAILDPLSAAERTLLLGLLEKLVSSLEARRAG